MFVNKTKVVKLSKSRIKKLAGLHTHYLKGEASLLPWLVDQLSQEKDSVVFSEIVCLLGELKDERAIVPLVLAYPKSKRRVQEALGKILDSNTEGKLELREALQKHSTGKHEIEHLLPPKFFPFRANSNKCHYEKEIFFEAE